jgi:hypothetical protein
MFQKELEINLIIGIFLSSTTLISIPGLSQTQINSKDCTGTIANVQSTIETGRNIQVLIRSNDISKDYPDHPGNRRYQYILSMQGKGANSIMSSPKFMQIIATRIIKNCNSVGLVSFALHETDYIILFGLMKDKTIKNFECLEAGGTKKVHWGYAVCL